MHQTLTEMLAAARIQDMLDHAEHSRRHTGPGWSAPRMGPARRSRLGPAPSRVRGWRRLVAHLRSAGRSGRAHPRPIPPAARRPSPAGG